MSDEGDKTCPLCAEEMDLTDQQLKPCKCGYEICVWCWHHIMDMAEKDETEGRCPACRSPYNKEKIVGMTTNCEKIVSVTSMDKKLTSRKGKSKTADSRKQLSSVRVIQRNLVYIVGLPLDLADEDLLQRKEYFPQYGKVLKVSISRTAAGAIQHFANNTCSVYITYSKEEEAVRCIQAVHGFFLDGRPLRACFGTTKYCHAWLRNVPCTNPDCLYLHEIGSQDDSFTKDEIVSAYTRSRVQQITGATISMQRRSGSVLPPPADEDGNNYSVSAGEPNSKTALSSSASCSPPNSSPGRSATLPAGASWGTRGSNNQPPSANAPCSTAPLNQKPETCSRATFSSALASTSQVSSLPADLGRQVVHGEESGNNNERENVETVEPARQYIGADHQIYSSENPSIPVVPASSVINSQFCSALLPKKNDKRMITQKNSKNAVDLSLISDGPGFSKHSNDASDAKIHYMCSDMSSLSVDKHQKSQDDYIEQTREVPTSQMTGESATSLVEICVARVKSDLRLDTQTLVKQGTIPKMEDDLLSFNEQRHRDPEVITGKGFSPYHSDSFHSLAQTRGYSPRLTDVVGHVKADLQIVDTRTESILQPTSIETLPNTYPKSVFKCVSDLECIDGSFCPFSTEDKKMHVERFEGEDASMDRSTAAETGENNIISNILSMDFDPWGESLTSPQNLAKLFGKTENDQGSLRVSSSRKLHNSNQSMFSFAREEEPVNLSTDSRPSLSYIEHGFNYNSNGHDFSNSRGYQLDSFGYQNGFSLANNEESNGYASSYSHLSSNKQSVSRSQMSAPPGFSAPNRAPPPGFASHERMQHNFDSVSGHIETSFLNNQYQTPPVGNVSNGDVEFMDPAILAVGKGRIQNGLNISNVEMSSSFPPQLSTFDEARLQLLMQSSLAPHQNQRFVDTGNNFSPFSDTYGISSRVMDQTMANNLSAFSQLTHPQHRNSVMSNGPWNGWDQVRSGNDLGGAELLRSERPDFNKFFTGYEDSKFRVPNSGDLYNRTFGI